MLLPEYHETFSSSLFSAFPSISYFCPFECYEFRPTIKKGMFGLNFLAQVKAMLLGRVFTIGQPLHDSFWFSHWSNQLCIIFFFFTKSLGNICNEFSQEGDILHLESTLSFSRKGQCYGLNCFPLKSICQSPNPHYFRMWLYLEVGSLMT